MANPFPAIEALLEIEGKRSNHALDSGGDTAWGITRRHHPDMWVNGPPTREAAAGFYLGEWWNPLRLGELSSQTLAEMILEFAVNAGPITAGRAVQDGYNGAFPPGFAPLVRDGKIGPKTVAALNGMVKRGEEDILCMAVLARICQHYEDLIAKKPSQRAFWRGWLRRMWV
jgi:lysozyme family protein